MALVRFVGLPRPAMKAALTSGPGWRALGLRINERAKATCPVGDSPDRPPGPHLKETLEPRFITGTDPRILIGSSKRGDVLKFVIEGTDPHDIYPVRAKALRFTQGGTVVFAQHVSHPGTKANPFITKAMRDVVHESIRLA